MESPSSPKTPGSNQYCNGTVNFTEYPDRGFIPSLSQLDQPPHSATRKLRYRYASSTMTRALNGNECVNLSYLASCNGSTTSTSSVATGSPL